MTNRKVSNIVGIWLSLLTLPFCNSSMATGKADLAITVKCTPDPAPLYSPITSTVAVKNFGPARARKIRVTLQLPANTELQSDIDGCKFKTERDRYKSLLTCKLKRLDSEGFASWKIIFRASQPDNLVFAARVSSSNRDSKRDNNTFNQVIVVTPSQGGEGFDACGCSAGTLWHPEMNHCLPIGLCDLPTYKGQCQTGDQCIACSENGVPQRPLPGGVCPQPCIKDCNDD